MALISIVMASLNSEKYLKEALTSISNQTFQNFEILLVDGGSTDNTLRIAQTFPNLRVISQVSKGLFAAWNEGILASKSQLITFLDSDDYWSSNCLQEHVDQFNLDDNLLCSIGKVTFFLDSEMLVPPKHFKPSLLMGNHMALMPGCFLGKRSLFTTLVLFDETLDVTSDIAWFKMLKQSIIKIGFLSKTVLYKRVHSANLSYTAAKASTYQSELLTLLYKSLYSRQ
jgi:glycosyltransferase involved in cell wall biosynthesis